MYINGGWYSVDEGGGTNVNKLPKKGRFEKALFKQHCFSYLLPLFFFAAAVRDEDSGQRMWTWDACDLYQSLSPVPVKIPAPDQHRSQGWDWGSVGVVVVLVYAINAHCQSRRLSLSRLLLLIFLLWEFLVKRSAETVVLDSSMGGRVAGNWQLLFSAICHLLVEAKCSKCDRFCVLHA